MKPRIHMQKPTAKQTVLKVDEVMVSKVNPAEKAPLSQPLTLLYIIDMRAISRGIGLILPQRKAG